MFLQIAKTQFFFQLDENFTLNIFLSLAELFFLFLTEPTQERAESQACLSYPERQGGRRSQSTDFTDFRLRRARLKALGYRTLNSLAEIADTAEIFCAFCAFCEKFICVICVICETLICVSVRHKKRPARWCQPLCVIFISSTRVQLDGKVALCQLHL